MAYKVILFLTLVMLALAGVSNSFTSSIETCLTASPTAEQLAVLQEMALKEQRARDHGQDLISNQAFTVPTYFHVLADSKHPEGGWMTDAQLAIQLAFLNNHFNPHKISFTLAGTTHTINPKWADSYNDKAFDNSRKALRKGGYGSLNVFFQNSLHGEKGASFCTTPRPTGPDISQDACTIVSSSAIFDPATVVHETGHWLGLLHTFQGGCDPDPILGGDLIADTPAESEAHWDCVIGGDSCPHLPGLDPIGNRMSYTSCKPHHFSPGQAVRMHNQWNHYRAGHE